VRGLIRPDRLPSPGRGERTSESPLDDVDRAILHLLQRNARDLTPVDVAERLPVSDGTVRNRIARLEERGVATGYVPLIDDAAGFPLQIVFVCTARITDRPVVATATLGIEGVVNVRETMTGRRNVRVVRGRGAQRGRHPRRGGPRRRRRVGSCGVRRAERAAYPGVLAPVLPLQRGTPRHLIT
jgi:DNA-binding Lrp family transcriptional regulator